MCGDTLILTCFIKFWQHFPQGKKSTLTRMVRRAVADSFRTAVAALPVVSRGTLSALHSVRALIGFALPEGVWRDVLTALATGLVCSCDASTVPVAATLLPPVHSQ